MNRPTDAWLMDSLDRKIINSLQGGFPVSSRPFAEAALQLGTDEDELIRRISHLLEQGVLTRFGPMYNVDRMGGSFSLCALQVPKEDFDRVADKVNRYPEVAHNYAREHELNMWFVLASDSKSRIDEVIEQIENQTGLCVYNMPKREEFFVGLKFEA